MNDLQQAVYNQLGSDSMEEFLEELKDLAQHGADCGFSGFIYHHETTDFFDDNRKAILERIDDDIYEYGETQTRAEFIAGFRCLRPYTLSWMSNHFFGERVMRMKYR